MTANVATFPYDGQHYSPPAPVLPIEISAPGHAQSGRTVIALIDSGADATLVPIDVLEEIGARPIGYATLIGLGSESWLAEVYIINVCAGPHILYAIRALAMPTGSGSVLGRDVLNHLTITLNGPAGAAELTQ